MRPVRRGDAPKDEHGIAIAFTDHKQARDPLIVAISDHCSYCEASLDSEIAVEHVEPKDGPAGKPHLALNWDNFLLACKYWNEQSFCPHY